MPCWVIRTSCHCPCHMKMTESNVPPPVAIGTRPFRTAMCPRQRLSSSVSHDNFLVHFSGVCLRTFRTHLRRKMPTSTIADQFHSWRPRCASLTSRLTTHRRLHVVPTAKREALRIRASAGFISHRSERTLPLALRSQTAPANRAKRMTLPIISLSSVRPTVTILPMRTSTCTHTPPPHV